MPFDDNFAPSNLRWNFALVRLIPHICFGQGVNDTMNEWISVEIVQLLQFGLVVC